MILQQGSYIVAATAGAGFMLHSHSPLLFIVLHALTDVLVRKLTAVIINIPDYIQTESTNSVRAIRVMSFFPVVAGSSENKITRLPDQIDRTSWNP